MGNFPGENGSVCYGERLLVGYRWYDAHGLEVSYPFGHGLSYTSFAYRDLDVQVLADGAAPRVRVAFTVSNTGDRAGAEIAQVYVYGQHGRMMRAIPLSRLSRFPGAPFSEAALADAVKRFSK